MNFTFLREEAIAAWHRFVCVLIGHRIGATKEGPWPGWHRYHCQRCDCWTLCLMNLQITTDVRGADR